MITIITALCLVNIALLTWIYIDYKEKKELNEDIKELNEDIKELTDDKKDLENLIESIDEQLRSKYRLTIKNADGELNITNQKRIE